MTNSTSGGGRSGRPMRLGAAIVAAASLLVLLAPTTGVDAVGRSHSFDDVPDVNPFHDDISWMAESGFSSGYSDGTYRPDTPLSRQHVVQLLWRMSGEPLGPFLPATFTDVPATHPFRVAIEWATALGITSGYADGRFRPNATMSRQSLGAMLHRLSGMETYFAATSFVDVTPTSAFAQDIWWWTASGQADGYSDGTFRPTELVSRQSAAALLHRFHLMLGGRWPYHAHSHVCTDPVTPEQQAAADQLVVDVAASIAANWPTRAAAEAAGYHQVGPTISGFGAHLVNPAFRGDGVTLDPLEPEVLMVDNGASAPVRGAMFVEDVVGQDGDRIGGCLTQWHAHENICFTAPFFEGGDFVSIASWSGGCPGDSMVFVTPQMLHVFIDGRANPFEGLET